MVQFDEFTLENGLRVIVHNDKSTPIVAVNLLYDVGAKDEDENKTGFAHLFEHLMFGGSVNIPSFDTPLQEVGGDNNAFTSNDLTNYYITLPKENLEVAFWLESDRMLSLAFTKKSLEIQRQVVIEEFKQRYLNQPYGDVYLLLRPLAYKKHPYRWATIGKEVSHIEDAKMEDVKSFFYKFYRPNNAILSLAGDVTVDEIKLLTEKWFGEIPKGDLKKRNLPIEEEQSEERRLTVERDVPLNAIYLAYHIVPRTNPDYYVTDLISDILSSGDSSRFHQKLIKKMGLFSELDAYISGDIDAGLLIISGKLNTGIEFKHAESVIKNELSLLANEGCTLAELNKVKNKVITSHKFSTLPVLNKAMGLAISALIESPELFNKEVDYYNAIKLSNIKEVGAKIFKDSNCSILHYKAKS